MNSRIKDLLHKIIAAANAVRDSLTAPTEAPAPVCSTAASVPFRGFIYRARHTTGGLVCGKVTTITWDRRADADEYCAKQADRYGQRTCFVDVDGGVKCPLCGQSVLAFYVKTNAKIPCTFAAGIESHRQEPGGDWCEVKISNVG